MSPKRIQMNIDADASKAKAGIKQVQQSFESFEKDSLKYAKALEGAWTTITRRINMSVSAMNNLNVSMKTSLTHLGAYEKHLDSILRKTQRLGRERFGGTAKSETGTTGAGTAAAVGAGAIAGGLAGAALGGGTSVAAAGVAKSIKEMGDTAKKANVDKVFDDIGESIDRVWKKFNGATEETVKLVQTLQKFKSISPNADFINSMSKFQYYLSLAEMNARKAGFSILGVARAASIAGNAWTKFSAGVGYLPIEAAVAGFKKLVSVVKQLPGHLKKANVYLGKIALKGLKAGFKSVLGLAKNIGSAILRWGTLIGAAAITLATVKFGKALIQAAADAEYLRLRLVSLTKDQATGTRLFKDLAKFASTVPFEFENILQSAVNLTGVFQGTAKAGTNIRKMVMDWMPMIADIAAGTGITIQETMSQIIRMYSAGARAADLFRERGVTAMLGFEFGKEYSQEETREQLMLAAKDTHSMFKDLSQKLASTWTGTVSMLKDKWFLFRLAIMDSGPFEVLKGYITDINNKLNEFMASDQYEPFIRMFAEKLVNAVSLTITVTLAFGRALTEIVSIGLEGIAGLIKAVRKLNEAYASFSMAVYDVADAIDVFDWFDFDEKSREREALFNDTIKGLEDIEKGAKKVSSDFNSMASDINKALTFVNKEKEKLVAKLQEAPKGSKQESQSKDAVKEVSNIASAMASHDKAISKINESTKSFMSSRAKDSSELLKLQGKEQEAEILAAKIAQNASREKSKAILEEIKKEEELLKAGVQRIEKLNELDKKKGLEPEESVKIVRQRQYDLSKKALEDLANKKRDINAVIARDEELAGAKILNINRKYAYALLDEKTRLNAQYAASLGKDREAEIAEANRAYQKDLENFKNNKEIQELLQRNHKQNIREINKKYDNQELDERVKLEAEHLRYIGRSKEAEVLELKRAYEKDMENFRNNKEIQLQIQRNFNEQMKKYTVEEEGSAWDNWIYGKDEALKAVESMNAAWQTVGAGFQEQVADQVVSGMSQMIDAIYQGKLTWESFAMGVQQASIDILKWMLEIVAKSYLMNTMKDMFGGGEDEAVKTGTETAAITAKTAAITAQSAAKVAAIASEMSAEGAAYSARLGLIGAETGAVGTLTTAYIALAAAKAAAGAGGGGGGGAAAAGGGMASGGYVSAGTSYIVGEKGPELFTPGRSGAITPNDKLGTQPNVTVNPAEVAIFVDPAMWEEFLASPRGQKAQLATLRSNRYAANKMLRG